LKNYTTCIEFAGKMMREGTKEFYGKEWKKAAATSQMMIQIKSQWELAVGARNQAGMFQKSVELFEAGIERIEGQKGTVEADIANLRAAQEEGESDLAFKQRLKRADLLEKHTVGALNSVIRMLNGQKAKFQKKVDGNMEKADEMDANNHAMVKLEGPLGEKRPNPGEYIIMAQAGKGDKYGVNKDSQVFLAGGSFKHIAVFGGVAKPDDGSGYEVWRTIDGGGTKGKETLLRVRLSDRMIFHGQVGAKLPDAGSASGSQLAGWIDMEKLVEMRDEKMAKGKK